MVLILDQIYEFPSQNPSLCDSLSNFMRSYNDIKVPRVEDLSQVGLQEIESSFLAAKGSEPSYLVCVGKRFLGVGLQEGKFTSWSLVFGVLDRT
jgi:hypothetical protein